MTLSPEHREERRAATRATAADLLEDLHHIRDVLGHSSPSRRELRMLSATLRRLLIVDRDLTKVAAPRIKRIKLLAPDNRPYVKGSQRLPLLLFVSGGNTLYGMTFRAFTIYGAAVDDSTLDRLPNASETFRTIELRLETFLTQPVLYFDRQWVSRGAVIKHMANIGRGIHSANPKEQEDKTLSIIRRTVTYSKNTGIHIDPHSVASHAGFRYDPNALDVVLLELLAAAKYMVESPDVIRLEDVIRQELR